MRYFILLSVVFSQIAIAKIFSYGVLGDAGRWNAKAKITRKSIDKQGIKKLIIPGDNLYKLSQGYDSVWKHWSHLEFYAVAIGNHKLSYKEEVAYFKMPGEYYAVVEPGVARFLVLNSDNESNVNEQLAWFEKELQNATEPFVFPIYHHPSYTLSIFHPWTEKKAFQKRMQVLLEKYKNTITAVFSGHDHNASLVNFGEIPVIISGSAQDVRFNLPVSKTYSNGVHVETDWINARDLYWARLDVDSAGSATIRFVRSKDDHIGCEADLTSRPVLCN